jgi:hypothetical protein
MPLDQAQQVLSEHLKDHTHVCAVGPFVSKVVEELDDMGAARVGVGGRGCGVGVVGGGRDVRGAGSDEALEELDLVQCCFGVSGCGFDDFESDVAVLSGLSSMGLI